MGCMNSKLQGDSFDGVNTDAKASSTRKAKPSYSSQPGRETEAPAPTNKTTNLPTDDEAGVVSIAASPMGNWTADRARIRQDESAGFLYKKQPKEKQKNPYGEQATNNQVSIRKEPKRRSCFS